MLRTLFVFAILIPGIAVATVNRFAALLLYLWFALFRPQEWLWIDVSGLRLSLFLGALLVVPSFLTGIGPYWAHPISVASLAFLAAGLLGQLDAVAPAVSWLWLDYLFRLLLVSLLSISLLSDQRRLKLAVAVIAGSFGFHAAKAGLASVLGGGVRVYDGLAGAFGDNNGYAVGMAMTAPLLVACAQNTENRWLARGYGAAALLTVVAVISTFSRGGFLALSAAALTFTLLQPRRLRALVLLAVLTVPVVTFMTTQDGYFDRMQTISTYEESNESSALSRLYFWQLAVEMAFDHPFGVGLFGYETAYERYDALQGEYGRNRSVHSSHFQALAETGFLGALAFEAALFFGFLYALRARRRGRREQLSPEDARLFTTAGTALIASLTAFVVGGAFVAMALNDLLWLTLSLVAALDLISRRVCSEVRAANTSMSATAPPLSELPRWQPIRPGVA